LIYVQRNPALIPEKLLKQAEEAQQILEMLAESERKAFIKRKAPVWRAFAEYLAKMSYGKCWYSETPDPHSFFDIDHFRPKMEAWRAEAQRDDGYPWLAFSWENFRYAAQRANRLSTDGDTDEVVGKGSWFPLLEGSPVASWANRCIDQERPILLDPTIRQDVDLIDIDANGRVHASWLCIGMNKMRVDRSIELYGLNLDPLVSARKRRIREIKDLHADLTKCLIAGAEAPCAASHLPIMQQAERLRRATLPSQPYSRAARAELSRLSGGADLLAGPEDPVVKE
jgi:hypothetical protein